MTAGRNPHPPIFRPNQEDMRNCESWATSTHHYTLMDIQELDPPYEGSWKGILWAPGNKWSATIYGDGYEHLIQEARLRSKRHNRDRKSTDLKRTVYFAVEDL